MENPLLNVDAYTVIEEAQVIFSLIGMSVSFYALLDAKRMYDNAVETKGIPNGRRIVAIGYLIAEVLRFTWQFSFFAMADVSLFFLPSPPSEEMRAVLAWLTIRKILALIGCILCLFLTCWDLFVRHHIRTSVTHGNRPE